MTCMYAINAVNIQSLVLTLNKYIGSSPLFIHSSCISFSLSLSPHAAPPCMPAAYPGKAAIDCRALPVVPWCAQL